MKYMVTMTLLNVPSAKAKVRFFKSLPSLLHIWTSLPRHVVMVLGTMTQPAQN